MEASYKFIRFGDTHGPKPYKFKGFGDAEKARGRSERGLASPGVWGGARSLPRGRGKAYGAKHVGNDSFPIQKTTILKLLLSLVPLRLRMTIVILMLVVLDRFLDELGPETCSNGSGSKDGVERL